VADASTRITNWAGQYSCTPAHLHVPRDIQEVVAGLASARGSRLRVLGAAHSPSDIAMSETHLMRLDAMDRILSVDGAAATMQVQAGATLRSIAQVAAQHGLAFPVLGSIDAQTIAGAIATATHGTGMAFGVISTIVTAIELVTPAGDVLHCSAAEKPDIFQAARCGLGVLGVIVTVTLQLSPAFDLDVTEAPNSFDAVLEALPERLRSVDHYRFWYLPHAERMWEWAARRIAPNSAQHTPKPAPLAAWWNDRVVGYHAFQALLYFGSHFPAWIPAINRWYAARMFAQPRRARGPSHGMFTFDCLFRQHVTEWAIPVEHTAEAMRRLRDLIASNSFRVHLPIEVRFTQADDIWLSPAQGRDTCYIGIIAYLAWGRGTEHAAYFAAFEALMAELGGRPHWAKRFGPESAWLATRYPHWQDFQRVRRHLDPEGRMANAYTDRVIGAVAP
jgi:L-gulonolactone oxidase